jgi:CDP-glucose 4,6-dehydratase
MCEIAVKSYFESFFSKGDNIKIATCRAGNVIGGGDWGEKRLVPDAVRAWKENKTLEIRSPNSIRPWNYVLDLISGYLSLAANLDNPSITGGAFNFGPNQDAFVSVENLTRTMWEFWPNRNFEPLLLGVKNETQFEHKLLKLYSDKSFDLLHWKPKTPLDQALKETMQWYSTYLDKPFTAHSLSERIIEKYIEL